MPSATGAGVTPSGAAESRCAVLAQLLRVGEGHEAQLAARANSVLRLLPSRTLIVPSLVIGDVAVGELQDDRPVIAEHLVARRVTSSPRLLSCIAPLRV